MLGDGNFQSEEMVECMNYLQLASVPEQSDFLQFFATEFSTFLGSKSVPLESDLSGIMMPPSTTTPQIPTFQEIFHNWKVFNVKQTQNYPNKISVPILVAKNIPRIEKKWARLIISLDRESINFIIWRLDMTENMQRMRRRLRRKVFENNHVGAARESSQLAKPVLPPTPPNSQQKSQNQLNSSPSAKSNNNISYLVEHPK